MAAINKNKTILVVEEDQLIAFLLEYLLHREGYRVITITPVQYEHYFAGIKLPPQLIIMGDKLSHQANNRLINDIRNCQAWREVPIILLTRHHEKQAIERALDSGADDILMQPFHQSELMAQIERHIVNF